MRTRTITLINATPTIVTGIDGNPNITTDGGIKNREFNFTLDKAIEVETGTRLKLTSFTHTGTTGVIIIRLKNLFYNSNLNIINSTVDNQKLPVLFSGNLNKTNDYSVVYGGNTIILNKQTIINIILQTTDLIETPLNGISNDIRFIATLQIEED